MPKNHKIAFAASDAPIAQQALSELTAAYGSAPMDKADVIVALGGDGFMLQTLHGSTGMDIPVYGMNCGTIGFLMNKFSTEGLLDRLDRAEETVINPLAMVAECIDGSRHTSLAFNEVSLLRAGSQAAKLRITVDGKVRMQELACDGALLCTPAGSTAYNYSAHGPILPIDADVLALTAMSAYRPRRWRGALLPKRAAVRFDVLDAEKRPVMADADGRSAGKVLWVEVKSEPDVRHRLLFDPGHGLEERLIREQFV